MELRKIREKVNVSVLIPVYNVEKYIERCVRSLFGQTMREGVEFIFLDDATPDDSIAIIKGLVEEFPDRSGQVTILHHEINGGIGASRNTCLQAAQGKYIIFCDSDDYFEPDMLMQMYSHALKSDADMAIADYYKTFPSHEEIIRVEIHDSLKERMKSLLQKSGSSVGYMLWNKLVRKNIYENISDTFISGFDYREDLAAVARILMSTHNIVKVPGAYAHYVTYNGSSISKTFSENVINSHFRAIEILSEFENDLGPEYQHLLDVMRFEDKLTALIHTEGDSQKKILDLYPSLNYSKLINNIPLYWRLPYLLALKERPDEFNRIKYILLKIKSLILNLRNQCYP
ncbi:MAG: glycosyltransferase [Muribaculaceae bacterium]|nr:glycosyltransferase [Muribaculaceae bacterium]